MWKTCRYHTETIVYIQKPETSLTVFTAVITTVPAVVFPLKDFSGCMQKHFPIPGCAFFVSRIPYLLCMELGNEKLSVSSLLQMRVEENVVINLMANFINDTRSPQVLV